MKEPEYKTVRMKAMKWLRIKLLAEALQSERGGYVSLPNAIDEAIQYYEQNRTKNGQ